MPDGNLPDGTPNPAGPRYPWSVGGSSITTGVPDNWDQYYPTIGHGRGDSWMGPKFELNRDAEVAGSREANSPALSLNARKRAERDPAYAAIHPEALSGNAMDWPGHAQGIQARSSKGGGAFGPYQDPHHEMTPAEWEEANRIDDAMEMRQASQHGVSWDDWVKGEQEKGFRDANGVPYGRPGAMPDPHARAPSADPIADLLRNKGTRPGPVNRIGGGIGSGGYWDGQNRTNVPGGAAASALSAPRNNVKQGLQQIAGMSKGVQAGLGQMKAAGFGKAAAAGAPQKKYRVNKKGAMIDITDPNNRIRMTGRGGGAVRGKGAAAAALAAGEKKKVERAT